MLDDPLGGGTLLNLLATDNLIAFFLIVAHLSDFFYSSSIIFVILTYIHDTKIHEIFFPCFLSRSK